MPQSFVTCVTAEDTDVQGLSQHNGRLLSDSRGSSTIIPLTFTCLADAAAASVGKTFFHLPLTHPPVCLPVTRSPKPKASIKQAYRRSMQQPTGAVSINAHGPLGERALVPYDWSRTGRFELDQAAVVITLSAARPIH